jgi:methionyl-tRNA formyltransferase
MKIIFFGTPSFAAQTLAFLLAHNVNVAAVVTKPARPKGRSGAPVATPVKEVALAHGLPVHEPLRCSSPDFAPILAAYQADLFVVVAYGEIIKDHLLHMPRLGCLNVHPSLLPKYRGAAPIQRCLMAGERETGVCIMTLVREMDAGDILRQARVSVDPDVTAGELGDQLCALGAQELLMTLRELEAGVAKATPQDHAAATFAPKVELEDCQIDWRQPAQTIHNLVRAANPEPGAWANVEIRGQPKRMKIWRTECLPNNFGPPGSIHGPAKSQWVVGCGEGAVRLLQVQIEGKKAMSVDELLRGLRLGDLAFTQS